MEARRLRIIAAHVARNLREDWVGLAAAPEGYEVQPDFAAKVLDAVREADGMGVRNHAAFCNWAELRHDFGEIAQRDEVMDFVRYGHGESEERSLEMIEYRVAYLRERWHADLERHRTLDALRSEAQA